MPEPIRPPVRQTDMVRTLVGAALAALLLAGCGSADEGAEANSSEQAETPAPTQETTPAGCTAPDGAVRVATTLTDADLDGDGTVDAVGITNRKDPCPGQLFAEVGDTDASVPLPDGEPPVRSAFAVTVPGQEDQLVVTRQDHPRGGFQTRVFALEDDELVELQQEGQPLVPFVATDSQGQLNSIDCADEGLVVTSAVPHEPGNEGWDVTRTTYALDDGVVTVQGKPEVVESVPSASLQQQYPGLLLNAAFSSCRVPSAGAAAGDGGEADHSGD